MPQHGGDQCDISIPSVDTSCHYIIGEDHHGLYRDGHVNTGIECKNDGSPTVTVEELMHHLNEGDLEDFVRSLDAQIVKR